jgi:hypothetical protein
MSKNINFRARSKTEFEIQLKPYPAVKQLPKWFTDASPYNHNNGLYPDDGKLHVRNMVPNFSFKKCTPLLDGLTSGYIIPLWADVMVEQNNGFPLIFWKTRNDIFNVHGESAKDVPSPVGYDQVVYKYNNCWIPETPKGYSSLIISPLGYNDLAFKAVPAIVDTDSSTLELVFPMWVKTGFEGVVEKGTPLVQIIPFKRDNWESTFNYYEDREYESIVDEKNFQGTIVGHYLKNHHSKKRFK